MAAQAIRSSQEKIAEVQRERRISVEYGSEKGARSRGGEKSFAVATNFKTKMIRNAIILKGLNLSIVTCWMKNLTTMMILHDIYRRFRLFKSHQIN